MSEIKRHPFKGFPEDLEAGQGISIENKGRKEDILKKVSNFRSKIEEQLSSGKRSSWADAFNNNFTPIFAGCDLMGISENECNDVINFAREVEDKALVEDREVTEDEKEKVYELVEKLRSSLE
ncbi:MAG: hypothetical protein WCO18_02160 [bacterium]